MGRIAMAFGLAALAGIGFDEIAERHPQLDIGRAQILQNRLRPRQLMQHQILGLDLAALGLKWLHGALDHQRNVIIEAAQRPI